MRDRMNAAVIIDNRMSSQELDACIDRHMPCLPNWQLIVKRPLHLRTGHDYNRIMTSVPFWREMCNYERVLIFQHDSGLLREGIDEFLQWDYVGAPWRVDMNWARADRKGGNGGLSLRNPKKALNLIERRSYDARYGNEDVFFVHHLEEVGAKVAPYEVCTRFSVESEFQLDTFGYHAIDQHLSEGECDTIRNQRTGSGPKGIQGRQRDSS